MYKHFGWPSSKVSSMLVLLLMVLHALVGCFAQPKVGLMCGLMETQMYVTAVINNTLI